MKYYTKNWICCAVTSKPGTVGWNEKSAICCMREADTECVENTNYITVESGGQVQR